MSKQEDNADMGRPSDDSPRFAAFISYSHADELDAVQLHRRLESYRLPPHVREQPKDKQIGKVFRDRADLAAATHLPTAIRSALAQSAALVVLCSPDARQSRWVDEEIRFFRELHPDAPVLPVIIRAEPAEAMPAALVEDGREPLAADFRRDADGPKLGFLKIVAALKGVPLDSLIQRDAQRSLRRVIAVTVVGGIVLLAMAAMTLFALSARREAERQRAEAEGLIEYMLTDLREGLRGVGRIDLMNAVNDRAFDYYDHQRDDLARLSDDSLERRSRVLMAMGEDEFRRDRRDQASRLFAEAYSSTQAALRRSPEDPDRVFAHAQSAFWMGSIAAALGQAVDHRRHWQAYAALAERLYVLQPDMRSLRETGYAQGNLCTLDLRYGDRLADAERHCRAALAIQRQVLARNPQDRVAQVDVANRMTWLAEILARRNNFEGAAAVSAEALQQGRAIVADDPANRDSQDLLFAILQAHGRFLLEVGERRDATAAFDEALALVAELQSVDPTNARWRRLAVELRMQRASVVRN